MNFLIAYIAATIVFLAADAIWLGVIMKDAFQNGLGHLLADKPNLGVAAGFYIMYVVGIVFFATMPAVKQNDWMMAALYGALFGFFCYATYEMTNLATLKDWPVKTAIADMAWGAFLSGLTATAGYFAVMFFNR